jgi:cytochrome c553
MPLAGMKADTFIKTMLDFRTGERDSTLMRGLALAYSDEEIAAMGKYFESLEVGGEK